MQPEHTDGGDAKPRQRYFKVGPAFWTANPDWTDDERLLALYLLTSPHRTTERLYRLPVAYVTDDIGWPADRVLATMSSLTARDFMEYDHAAKVVLIVSALKWQQPDNGNAAKACVKALATLPPTRLAARFRSIVEEHAKYLWKELPEGLPIPVAIPIAVPVAEGYADPLALTPAPVSISQEPEVDAAAGATEGPERENTVVDFDAWGRKGAAA